MYAVTQTVCKNIWLCADVCCNTNGGYENVVLCESVTQPGHHSQETLQIIFTVPLFACFFPHFLVYHSRFCLNFLFPCLCFPLLISLCFVFVTEQISSSCQHACLLLERSRFKSPAGIAASETGGDFRCFTQFLVAISRVGFWTTPRLLSSTSFVINYLQYLSAL